MRLIILVPRGVLKSIIFACTFRANTSAKFRLRLEVKDNAFRKDVSNSKHQIKRCNCYMQWLLATNHHDLRRKVLTTIFLKSQKMMNLNGDLEINDQTLNIINKQ